MALTIWHKKRCIAKDVKPCNNPLAQARGNMFRTAPKNLLFTFPTPRRVTIHMFFVFFPLHIIYLDEQNNVIDKAHLRPFQWHTPSAPAKRVLELASNNSHASTIKTGDTLTLSPQEHRRKIYKRTILKRNTPHGKHPNRR
ncbi:DUF192 domain-containing protein [Candidatus Woesearchaeota archaeon]|nr:MAG: DUF192 domain-containing protein [Candidatus Woesearchaeota archaeon]